MKKIKLNKSEKAIEAALVNGEYRAVSEIELKSIAESIVQKRKDAVLNIRVNGQDLKRLKEKAKRLGVPYQSFISELLHRFAA